MKKIVLILLFVSVAANQFNLSDNPGVVAFITDSHRKVDFYNLPSRADLYLSVCGHNPAGIGIPSAPVAIKTL